jgi:hypothetical protein
MPITQCDRHLPVQEELLVQVADYEREAPLRVSVGCGIFPLCRGPADVGLPLTRSTTHAPSVLPAQMTRIVALTALTTL